MVMVCYGDDCIVSSLNFCSLAFLVLQQWSLPFVTSQSFISTNALFDLQGLFFDRDTEADFLNACVCKANTHFIPRAKTNACAPAQLISYAGAMEVVYADQIEIINQTHLISEITVGYFNHLTNVYVFKSFL